MLSEPPTRPPTPMGAAPDVGSVIFSNVADSVAAKLLGTLGRLC